MIDYRHRPRRPQEHKTWPEAKNSSLVSDASPAPRSLPNAASSRAPKNQTSPPSNPPPSLSRRPLVARRTVTTKAPRFYPAEDVRQPKKSRKSPKAPSLRSSITPGTVVILLAGRYRGKRVVFLKQLASGLLLVTGPYKVNGVPLRRVNQAYVIATSTKVDISGVKVDDKFDDAYFSKPSTKTASSAEEEFFEEGKPKAKEPFPESKAADQKAVDSAILAAVKGTESLSKYLKASWGLSKGQFPHQLVF
ncbi:unnamed protein product [Cyclocybe aegerita]|uniref:60S ribosomal protein L6 n=1 Tax=Cyclocybe aegerita TaxID=1973307 RepID=A0A8S0WVL0_CYCAE|nr:unnamed protein product [Cyclocybe aegerita]